MSEECQFYNCCLRKHLCFKCHDHDMLELPRQKTGLRPHPERNKRGIELEVKVEKMNNDVARRRLNSGAISGMKGDVRTVAGLEECKKRYVTSNGKKSFTVQLDWLVKIMKEARDVCGMGTLVFQFAEDNRLFCVKSYEDELADRQLIQELLAENKRLRKG